jgi:hypothetical protein
MASPVPFDDVMETTVTTGTGTLTLTGAVAGYQSFAAVGNKGKVTYCIQAVDANGIPTGDREVGQGTYTVAGTTLSRDKVLSSSNSGALVSFAAGTKRVFLTIPASGYGPLIVPPGPSSVWTWANQGTASVADGPGGSMSMTIPDVGSANWRLLYQNAPATPYSVIARIQSIQAYANSNLSGVYFYDGTKLMGVEFLTQSAGVYNLRVEKINNVTTDGSTPFVSTIITINATIAPVFVRLRNDGSTLSFDVSPDGLVFYNLFSEAVGTFITPTACGFGGLCVIGSGFSVLASLTDWIFLNTAAA